MTKRFCDMCGKELEKSDGYSFKAVKVGKVYFLHRDVFPYEKKVYDSDEYCWDCFTGFLNCYDEYKKARGRKDNERSDKENL